MQAGSQEGLGQRAKSPLSCRLSMGCFPTANQLSTPQPWAGFASAPRLRDDSNDTRPGWVHEMQRVTRKVSSACDSHASSGLDACVTLDHL